MASTASYEMAKKRVLAKLEDRLDMGSSKRMPTSLLRQSLRQHAEALVEHEFAALTKADRDRLIDEVLRELLGYGPLEELCADPQVREILVTGPGTVIARRDQGHWLPTSVKFRDDKHLRSVLDRMASHAEAVGPVMASVATFDLRLPNGFRALAVIPPEALEQAPMLSLIRENPPPTAAAGRGATTAAPGASATASTSAASAKAVSASPLAPGRPPSGDLVTTPAPPTKASDQPPSGIHDPLLRHRNRILERLLHKFASLGLYDIQKLDVSELQKIITAYVSEYTVVEKIYLSDTDQGRLILEILTSLCR
ncbi:MAG: hypothetical protein RMJ56_14125 [Gemmataceae bacterium]|nr:hypothetical protein [Gemmata sp.]MDW8198730.1 hypothetical protein [Gemmataceae bacterium]